MKKLLVPVLIFSVLISAQEADIKLLCNYIDETEERFAYESMTSYFTEEPVTIKIFTNNKASTFNDSYWEYFTEVKPLEIIISTKVIMLEDMFEVVNFRYYEFIEINRQTGEMMVRNYTKQGEGFEDESIIDNDKNKTYPLAFTKKYECQSLKVKF